MAPGDIAWWTVALVVAAAFCAGWVDAVVGGGGLIQLPVLLLALPQGLPFATISGTNKMSSVAGTSAATATYLRGMRVRWSLAGAIVGGAASGAVAGAFLARLLPKAVMTPVLLVVMVVIGLYTWRRPQLGMSDAAAREDGVAAHLTGAGVGIAVGTWDGAVGPGTGTLFILAFVSLLGMGFLRASAYAKLANLTTNIAAIAVFAAHGQVLWWLAVPMAAANLAGGVVGARLAVRHGNGFVRRVFLVVVGALAAKMAWDTTVMMLAAVGAGR